MADNFSLLNVTDAKQLHESLTELLKNKKHIESIVVDAVHDEIRVDLSRMANTFGKSDFKLRIKTGRGDEVRGLIERLKQQESPARHQSEELFELLQH